jgi:hypothetical protein
MALKVSDLEVLRIMLGIGPSRSTISPDTAMQLAEKADAATRQVNMDDQG